MGPLTVDERKRVIRCYFRRFFRELSPELVDRIAATDQAKNPLFLRAVLEELRVHGTFEGLPDQITGYLAIPTIPKLYEAILARYEADYEDSRPHLVRDLCRLVLASRRGLSRDELRGLLRDPDDPLPDAYWAPLLLAMQQGLVEKGDVLTFFHDYLREAVRAKYLPTKTETTTAHLDLAGYFERRPDGPRRLEELPWQFAKAGAWDRLVALLKEPAFFSAVYSARKFDLLRYWAEIEQTSPYRVVEAYAGAAGDPSFDDDGLNRVALLLRSVGHPAEAGVVWETMAAGATDPNVRQAWLCNQTNILAERGDLDGAMALYKEQERICRDLGNINGLQSSLGNQALILKDRGDLDGAMKLMKEQERICRELGNVDDLQASLGNQANILSARGDLDGAMKLMKEQERICRELGDVKSLAISLGNQALILADRGDPDGAMALHKEQERICRELGNVESLARSLANQAVILDQQDRRGEASRAIDEALALATKAGYSTLAAHIRGIKEQIGL